MEETSAPLIQIFVKLLDGKTSTLTFPSPSATVQSIKNRISEITKIPTQSQRLISNGKQLSDTAVISTSECTVHLLLRLIGGKGGFGSLLRGAATKAGQKKTNNFDACRDMSGRRLRHVNAEKRLEEWKAGEEERRLEKLAEEFLKKNAKKGKKGVGDGAAEKYVAKYREESARCAKQVEEAVREACGSGKRKGKGVNDGVDSKKLKIWMGKRKMAESDSEGSSDDEEYEKSVVLNNSNSSSISKEANGSSDSVTGGEVDGNCSGGVSCESGSEEEKGAAAVEEKLKYNPSRETVSPEGDDVVEPENHGGATCSDTAEISRIDAVNSEKHKDAEPDFQPMLVSESVSVEVTQSKPISADPEIVVANVKETESEKPINFDDFSSAVEMEAVGMERLKNELQAHGLKCGGTLQERAARLFLLKTTPLDKLPKKLLAKK